MKKKILLPCSLLLFPFPALAQEKIIDTVQILDRHLQNTARTQSIITIKSEDFNKNATNLSEVLRFQSPVYIKENGRGMASSPSFRGTTAQQTAFVWNGINVNSVFLGQGDVNNLGMFGYDDIQVKPGGGSALYGSGAIGGSIHLNNELPYDKGWRNRIFLEGGSFKTIQGFFKSTFSNDDLSFSISGFYVQSENDYKVPKKFYINRNGQYENTTVNIGIAKKLDAHNELIAQSQIYSGVQHFPTSSESATKTKYETDNFRSLVAWNLKRYKFSNRVSAAYFEEGYAYNADTEKTHTNGGKAISYFFKDDVDYSLTDRLKMNFLSEFKQINASGHNSGIQNPEQSSGQVGALLAYQIHPKLYLETGVKKLWVQDYRVPLLYSFGVELKAARFYTVKLNASKNYRTPTFNDLFWKPGGNPDLKPEMAYQGEIGNVLKFNNLSISATPFYIYLKNMIQWLPGGAGYYTPTNVYRVRSAGLEALAQYRFIYGNSRWDVAAGYSFTDSKNLETGHQLTYVPRHKIYANLNFKFKNILETYLQGNYNGLTYTTTDERYQDAIKPYMVLNAGASLTLMKSCGVGFRVSNLTNQVYETVSFFPMPLRNYAVNLKIIF